MSDLPKVFIASSREALEVAEAVNIRLESDAKIKQWDNAFDLSTLTLPTLLAKTKDADFAVFVFHKDDQTIIRGNNYSSVRDNVIFELGLFIGSLGIEKCFVLLPKSVEGEFRLPTDLAGLTMATYDDSLENKVDAVTTCCAKVKQVIRKATEVQAVPNQPAQAAQAFDLVQTLQSELWHARIDLQRAKEQVLAMHSAITNHFFAVAKPATEKEIEKWEEGAKNSYNNVPSIIIHNTFFVDQNVIVPPLYGANSISIIVAPGVRVFGLEQGSHNSVYFMDGFRKFG